jgi:hypothetical protein
MERLRYKPERTKKFSHTNFNINFTATPTIYIANTEKLLLNVKFKLCCENTVSEFPEVFSLLPSFLSGFDYPDVFTVAHN